MNTSAVGSYKLSMSWAQATAGCSGPKAASGWCRAEGLRARPLIYLGSQSLIGRFSCELQLRSAKSSAVARIRLDWSLRCRHHIPASSPASPYPSSSAARCEVAGSAIFACCCERCGQLHRRTSVCFPRDVHSEEAHSSGKVNLYLDARRAGSPMSVLTRFLHRPCRRVTSTEIFSPKCFVCKHKVKLPRVLLPGQSISEAMRACVSRTRRVPS